MSDTNIWLALLSGAVAFVIGLVKIIYNRVQQELDVQREDIKKKADKEKLQECDDRFIREIKRIEDRHDRDIEILVSRQEREVDNLKKDLTDQMSAVRDQMSSMRDDLMAQMKLMMEMMKGTNR